ncbi:MAG: transcriptional regulator [Verrucomicrobiota bacterium]|nr:transcriptional regulator [Verrucomicrobiota bacterium]
MNQQLLSEIGRTQRLEILNMLKRTKGLSVNELVAKMKMSYMGIKQHCLTLERDGYLDTWRRPQKMGRPEMVYRLTRRSHDLYPCDSNDFTLELLKSIGEIHGANAPEKLLFSVFERKSAALKERCVGDTVRDRAKWLAQEREKEGFMSQYMEDEKDGGPQIMECHSPIMNLLDQYPTIARFEQDLVSNVLGVPVRREESRVSGLYESIFYFAV